MIPLVTLANASIGDCDSDGQPALGIVEVTSGSPDSTFYLDDRNWLVGNGIWTYEESNGIWKEKLAGVYFGDPSHESHQRGQGTEMFPTDRKECTDDPTLLADRLLVP